MSFRTEKFSPGILLPEELSMVQGVFKSISGQPWFSPSPEAQREFAAYVIETYLRGMTDAQKLQAFCIAAARARYAPSEDVSDPPALQTGPAR